jgi:hypothetical protein
MIACLLVFFFCCQSQNIFCCCFFFFGFGFGLDRPLVPLGPALFLAAALADLDPVLDLAVALLAGACALGKRDPLRPALVGAAAVADLLLDALEALAVGVLDNLLLLAAVALLAFLHAVGLAAVERVLAEGHPAERPLGARQLGRLLGHGDVGRPLARAPRALPLGLGRGDGLGLGDSDRRVGRVAELRGRSLERGGDLLVTLALGLRNLGAAPGLGIRSIVRLQPRASLGDLVRLDMRLFVLGILLVGLQPTVGKRPELVGIAIL